MSQKARLLPTAAGAGRVRESWLSGTRTPRLLFRNGHVLFG